MHPRARPYWEKIGSKETLALADSLLSLIRGVTNDQALALKYNRSYIGLARHGVPNNFITMRPAKSNMVTDFHIPRSDELQQRLLSEGFDLLGYDRTHGNYRLRLGPDDFANRQDTLTELVERAADVAKPNVEPEEDVVAGENDVLS